MSVGRMALESLGITGTYYSSEVDKYAIKASEALYPDSVQLGDVTKWREWDIDWSSIDLVTGGFPCQAWSMAGKQLGDKDERGMLFWVMLDIMKHVKYHNPKAHFMIENVKMKKEFEQYITTHTENALGHVHKILINSALVSAQSRNRYYWTNFEVSQPEDRGLLISDLIINDSNLLNVDVAMSRVKGECAKIKAFHKNVRKINHKHKTLLAGGVRPAASGGCHFKINCNWFQVTPRGAMVLQTIPEHHIDTLLTAGISNTQLYKMTGNAWTMEVIKHILKGVTKC